MTKPKPKLTREALHEALKPPNNCRVKTFLETLDPGSREVFEEALGYDKKDLPSVKVRDFAINHGFDEEAVPGVDAITDHRAGRRPCRCHG